MKNTFDGELWVPRTMWEKRRQLSAVIHRSMTIGRKMLVLSCDNSSTFFGRVDIQPEQASDFVRNGQLHYMQIVQATDLSRALGQIGLQFHDAPIDQILVDDVDLMIDLATAHSTTASLFALMYALKNRCREIILFSNPVRSEHELRYLMQMEDHLVVHAQPHQNVA